MEYKSLRVLSWNLDGLDKKCLDERTTAVCDIVKKLNPHVIFLQEVVGQSEVVIRSALCGYSVITSHDKEKCHYFTAILLKEDSLTKIKSIDIVDFPGSRLGRNLLAIRATVKDVNFSFMTSHLESYEEDKLERIAQLKISFEEMKKAYRKRTVIFGGDLNLLNDEENYVSGMMPENVHDLWEETGSNPDLQFTFDGKANDNREFKSKRRLDRIYIRHSSPPTLKPVMFELVGKDRLGSCQRFPSDHWGVLTHYEIIV